MPGCSTNSRLRGFTLLESLMASGILLAVVVSVTAAISAGQQHSHEAHLRIAAAMAAEELLGRITSQPYNALPAWHNHNEPVGQMTDMKGQKMDPLAYGSIGRSSTVTTSIVTVNATLNVKVRGATVRVKAFDAGNRVLTDITRFVPEPQP